MKDGPSIATVAALIGDPARANMLAALMDGRALTASELAEAAGVTIQTASGHLAKLDAARLLTAERQGRNRYFRLSGTDVAFVLEGLMGLAQRTGAVQVRTGPRDPALRMARVCYDHLAGELGVTLLDRLLLRGLLTDTPEPDVTADGAAFFIGLGVHIDSQRKRRRPLCRRCLDWSERRSHLGGLVGARLLTRMMEQGWLRRGEGRVILVTPDGRRALADRFGLVAD
ncbi:ArsR/SmtB family transcription factor [Chelatococcus reniformis]|uniref:ArsR/SmtB family transcription factor n=1 Tax=Chelatococcus reniformis TaxID=1494448 RepID=UPI00166A1089|nr:winged helix-turn-helix domain-containing protein [Chelatococcus reniformis]